MRTPVSTIEHSSKISVISCIDGGFFRNSAGDVVQAVPSILITAEFRGIWDDAVARDTDMQKTVEALIASYKNYVKQLNEDSRGPHQ